MSEAITAGRISRRALLGGAAGVVAAGAAARTLGPFRSGAGADADPTAHDMLLPHEKVGWQCFTFGGTPTLNATGREATAALAQDRKCLAWEGANTNAGFGNNFPGFQAYKDWCDSKGVRIVGEHTAPNPTSVGNLTTAVTKMDIFGTRTLGQGGGTPNGGGGSSSGTPGTPNRGTPAQQAQAVTNWINYGNTLNLWGRRFQHGFNLDGQGPRIDGGRYYSHMHTEWVKLVGLPDGHKYKDKRICEVLYDDEDGCDPDYSFVEIDLCWLYKGCAPYIGDVVGGITATANRQLNNAAFREFAADESVEIMRRWGDLTPFFHVKDCDANGNVATAGDTDLVPFKRMFEELNDPAAHEYLIERDGAGGTWPSVMQIGSQFLHTVRVDRSWLGAPANKVSPFIDGSAKAGNQMVVSDHGEWARWTDRPNKDMTFRWLREDPPANDALVAPGTAYLPIPGATTRHYRTDENDEGRKIVCEVAAVNPAKARQFTVRSIGTPSDPHAPGTKKTVTRRSATIEQSQAIQLLGNPRARPVFVEPAGLPIEDDVEEEVEETGEGD